MGQGPNTIVGGREPGRNDPCPCGSGLKYKHCHGDTEKLQTVRKFAVALMGQLIRRTKMEKGMIPWPFTCNACGKGFTQGKPSKIASGQMLCPHCNSTNFTQNEASESEPESSIIIGGNVG